MRKMTGFTAAAAVLVTTVGLSATPAEARGRHGGWHNRHDDGIGAGEIIGGILILGTIAAVASAASKQNRETRNRDFRYDPPYRDDRAQDVPDYQRRDDRGPDGYGTGDAYRGGEIEQRAADACGWAAEGEMGDDARVESITDTRPANGGDGWYVTGNISRPGGELHSFGCSYRGGRVVDVSIN
ncbi:MAG: hypothetical protein KAF42_10040 [Sphingopyxis terrae]|nr:hypothetical protein [Sphingopyxis terrae]